eukprot:TRINITY_DN5431_c0_g1_i1.p1 TRINITY_DN5431_c0_g1~~TRINITY_DN5431_c0_g1_i1.p1  ORF type:complete len:290 (+),score=37.48 TRINITY_DN5431_c0_g1_i1:412-1281(+)
MTSGTETSIRGANHLVLNLLSKCGKSSNEIKEDTLIHHISLKTNPPAYEYVHCLASKVDLSEYRHFLREVNLTVTFKTNKSLFHEGEAFFLINPAGVVIKYVPGDSGDFTISSTSLGSFFFVVFDYDPTNETTASFTIEITPISHDSDKINILYIIWRLICFNVLAVFIFYLAKGIWLVKKFISGEPLWTLSVQESPNRVTSEAWDFIPEVTSLEGGSSLNEEERDTALPEMTGLLSPIVDESPSNEQQTTNAPIPAPSLEQQPEPDQPELIQPEPNQIEEIDMKSNEK